MKILFYSEKCEWSKDIKNKLTQSDCQNEFQLINVDIIKVPDKIKVVPTIIDSDYKDLLEGKKAFEYLFNKKYFNISTNNLLLWKDKIIPKPEIEEDSLAKKETDDILESQMIEEQHQEPEPPKKQIKLKTQSLLMLKGRSS